MLGRTISQILVVGAVFAGPSLLVPAAAIAAPTSTGTSAADLDKANDRLKALDKRRSVPQVRDRGSSVYGPYISDDQVRLVAD
jgi:hypothetical protein